MRTDEEIVKNARDWVVTLESGVGYIEPGASRIVKVQPQVWFRALQYDLDMRFEVEECYLLNEMKGTKRDMLSSLLGGEKLKTTEPAEYIVLKVRNKGTTPLHYRLDLHGKAVL